MTPEQIAAKLAECEAQIKDLTLRVEEQGTTISSLRVRMYALEDGQSTLLDTLAADATEDATEAKPA